MKETKMVDFGYDNSMKPFGSNEGIGLGTKAVGPVGGEFLDVVNYHDNFYLITRITDAFKGSEQYIGKIDVRRALVDLFPDGSGILYIDQNQSQDCRNLTIALNSPELNNALKKNARIRDILSTGGVPFSFSCVTRGSRIIATAIKHEVFEKKNNLINSCSKPFSDMQETLENFYNSEEQNFHR